jgi:hypothetical protein
MAVRQMRWKYGDSESDILQSKAGVGTDVFLKDRHTSDRSVLSGW